MQTAYHKELANLLLRENAPSVKVHYIFRSPGTSRVTREVDEQWRAVRTAFDRLSTVGGFPQTTILLCCRRYLQLLDGYRDICTCVLAWVPVTVCACVGVLLVWCACAYMCTCACARMCTCSCAHVCMCACMCVAKGVLTYRCIPTYVYIVCMCIYAGACVVHACGH